MSGYKILDQANPAASTYVTLYTAPSGTEVSASTLTVCNTAAAEAFVRVLTQKVGEQTSELTKQFILRRKVAPDGSKGSDIHATIGLSLAPGERVRVWASTGDIAFNLYGVENP